MSPKLPDVSGREAIRAFGRLGYEITRQRGSHVRMRHPANARWQPLTVPEHDSIKPGLLHRLLCDADLTLEEFLDLLRQ